MKIFSIVVPAYNAQDYLDRCLDSLLVPDQERFRALEVIVVNDGSTDGTSVLAHRYEERYPGVFRVIDKENGNSGSCINAALAVARGKYFRELDSDDWFDTGALSDFIGLLDERNEDIVSTLKSNHFPDGETETYSGLGVEYGKTCLIGDFIFRQPMDKVHFTMHAMSFRTDFLRDIRYRQLEGLFYTDMIQCYYALKSARDIWFSKICLYQYSDGRDDQSMAWEHSLKYRHHFFLVSKNLLEDFIPIRNSLGENRRIILLEIIYNYVNIFYQLCPEADPDLEELDRLMGMQPELRYFALKQKLKQREAEMQEICNKLAEK